MPKVSPGRLSGLHGMTVYSAAELHAWADLLEAQANANGADSPDDPAWLRRWAGKRRRVAAWKDKARTHKAAQGRDRR